MDGNERKIQTPTQLTPDVAVTIAAPLPLTQFIPATQVDWIHQRQLSDSAYCTTTISTFNPDKIWTFLCTCTVPGLLAIPKEAVIKQCAKNKKEQMTRIVAAVFDTPKSSTLWNAHAPATSSSPKTEKEFQIQAVASSSCKHWI